MPLINKLLAQVWQDGMANLAQDQPVSPAFSDLFGPRASFTAGIDEKAFASPDGAIARREAALLDALSKDTKGARLLSSEGIEDSIIADTPCVILVSEPSEGN